MGPARRTVARLAALLAATLAVALLAAPAGAAPALNPLALAAAAPNGTDDEGGTATLRKQLDAASKGYLDAKAKLDNSAKRQKDLAGRLGAVEAELRTRSATVVELAGVAYRTGRLGPVSAMLNADTPDSFMDRAGRLQAMATSQDRQLHLLLETRKEQTLAKAAIEKEVAEQRTQLAVMTKRKQQAERALAVSGGGGSATGVGGTSTASAKPAPRNPDGSWPAESCSVNDPTTSGCITPRTLHALNEAKAAGFTRYVSCHRDGGGGEHPLGRACDFAAAKDGFGGVATGGDRTYGNNLAAYFVRNASKLAVLYVIWFKQIWLPSSGWKAYTSGNGDPASDHTNHVHLSVY